MDYKSYINILCQLHFKNLAKVVCEGKTLTIEANVQKNIWRFSTPICQKSIYNEVLTPSGKLHFLANGPFLQKRLDTIVLILETRPLERYLDFRKITRHLMEYKSLFETKQSNHTSAIN